MTGIYWKQQEKGAVPEDAVKGGKEIDGNDIYVGRAYYNEELLPAKIVPTRGCGFVSLSGAEHIVYSYDVCCGDQGAWKPDRDGHVPANALHVGDTKNGEKLYTGRFWHEGSLVPGKVQPSLGLCYIPFGGKELSSSQYEVLIEN